MSRRRRFLIGLVKVLSVIVALLVVAWVVFTIIGRQALTRELERVKASGAPTSWEQAIPPPVPDAQNAAPLYEKAFKALAFTRPAARPRYPPYPFSPVVDTGRRKAVEVYLAAKTRQERQALAKAAQEAVAANAQALAYARQAVKRPKLRFNRNWTNPVAMLVPEYAKLQDLSRLACAQAVLRADQGDVAGALDAWSFNVDMVRQQEADPLLIGQLSRYAILARAGMALERILQEGSPKVEDCRRLDQALAGLDLDRPLARTLEADRARDLWTLNWLRKTPRFYQSMTEGSRDKAAKLAWLAYRVLGPWQDFDDAARLRFWRRQIALLREPYRDSVRELDSLGKDIPRYALLTQVLFPVFSRVAGSRDTAAANLSLMRTALGLAAYRAQFARYPASLNELRRRLTWKAPEDPFNGKDLRYRVEGGGYVLYSIGPDLKDDGGKPGGYAALGVGARSNYVGDIVWRVAR